MTDSDRLQLDEQGQLQFPCSYPVKAMTHVHDRALEQVLDQIEHHATCCARDRIEVRPSRNGRFQSITVEVQVATRGQLEAVYASLRELDIVVMTL